MKKKEKGESADDSECSAGPPSAGSPCSTTSAVSSNSNSPPAEDVISQRIPKPPCSTTFSAVSSNSDLDEYPSSSAKQPPFYKKENVKVPKSPKEQPSNKKKKVK